jgi:hypothetical protein
MAAAIHDKFNTARGQLVVSCVTSLPCDEHRLCHSVIFAATAASSSDCAGTTLSSFEFQIVIRCRRPMHIASRQSFEKFSLVKILAGFVQMGATPWPASMSTAQPAGTIASLLRFSRMRIREENCNMVLLALVTCVSVAVAGGASLMGFDDIKPVRFADRTTGRVEQAPSPDDRIIYVSDQPPVRVIGAPFVPNTNPRER